MEVKRSQPFSGRVRGLFTFALLCVYALTACLLLLAGLQVYRSVKANANANYDGRTALAYITGKLRGGALPTGDNADVLTLTQSIEGTFYNTYIYCQNGQLCEYFASAERAFDPTLGESIASVASLRVTREDVLTHIAITDSAGRTYTACYRARGEVRP
ncbi:MAG: DUF4860 domain-containing protein [Clostridia bacterium]|nr:DUF4860 domain-containing protein [Clostridia bacterium]